MQLKMCDCVPKPAQRFFGEAFDLLIQKLGISDYDKTIALHLGQHEDKDEGSFCPVPDDDTIARVKAGKQPKAFMILMLEQNPAKMLETFCHEMIHLKQACVGELTYRLTNGRPQQFWQNCRITHDMPYMERPQEKEAHERMYELALWVARTMAARREGRNDTRGKTA
jgi:hypothetical protein